MDENIKVTENAAENVDDTPKAETKSAEETHAELLAENKRMKKAFDKASSEAAAYKKQLMATKSDDEKLSMEKAERDAALREELEMLRKESQVNKLAKSFMGMGYPEDMASKAAEAQFSGDADELLRIQKQHIDNLEKKIRAELMKKMPVPATGNDDELHLTQEQFDAMSYREQLDLYEKHPSVYEKFTK